MLQSGTLVFQEMDVHGTCLTAVGHMHDDKAEFIPIQNSLHKNLVVVIYNLSSLDSGKEKLQLIRSWVGNIFKGDIFWLIIKGSSLNCTSELSQSSMLTLSGLISQKSFSVMAFGMWKGMDVYEWRGRHTHESAHLLRLIEKETSPGVESKPDF